jgi:predicted small integral membrane protein
MPDESTQRQTPPKPASSIVSANSAAPPVSRPQGFLPFPTNAWDRIFVSGLCLVAIHLLWLRFIEAYIPLWGAMIISIALGVYIFKRG